MATIPLLVATSKKIKFIDVCLYDYLVRDGSVTTTFSDKHIIDYFKIYGILFNELHRLEFNKNHLTHLFEYVDAGMNFHSTNVVNSTMNDSDKQQYFRHLLMLKVSFIESYSYLVERPQAELLSLLKTASSIQDITPVKSGQIREERALTTSNEGPFDIDQKKKLIVNYDNTLHQVRGEMNLIKEDLGQTRSDLNKTKNELSSTKNKLKNSLKVVSIKEDYISRQLVDIDKKKELLANYASTIHQLRGEISLTKKELDQTRSDLNKKEK